MHREVVRSRRRLGVAVATGLLLVVAGAAVAVDEGGAAGAEPSSDINDYALFAYSTLQLKGKTSEVAGNIGAGTRHYKPGNIDEYAVNRSYVGSKDRPSDRGKSHIQICQGANPQTVVSGYIAAPSVEISFGEPDPASPDDLSPHDPCQVPKVYARALSGAQNIPKNVWPSISTYDFPEVTIPRAAQFVPGVPTKCDKKMKKLKGVKTLGPGVYGDLDVKGKTTLAAGDYTFCSLSVQKGSKLVATDDTRVYVANKVMFKGGNNGTVGAPGMKLFTPGKKVTFGRQLNIGGTIVAPNANVALGHTTEMHGRVWAYAMHSDWDIHIYAPRPTTPPTSTPPTTGPPAPTTTPTSFVEV